jgi:hypothetical protein
MAISHLRMDICLLAHPEDLTFRISAWEGFHQCQDFHQATFHTFSPIAACQVGLPVLVVAAQIAEADANFKTIREQVHMTVHRETNGMGRMVMVD